MKNLGVIHVDVEIADVLNEIEDKDLINELKERGYDYSPYPQIEVTNLMDSLKLEHIVKVFDKYSLEELTQLIPEDKT